MSASQSPRAPWRTVHRGARPRVLPPDTPAISWGGCREEPLVRVLGNLPVSQAPLFAPDPQPILGLQLPYRQPLFAMVWQPPLPSSAKSGVVRASSPRPTGSPLCGAQLQSCPAHGALRRLEKCCDFINDPGSPCCSGGNEPLLRLPVL